MLPLPLTTRYKDIFRMKFSEFSYFYSRNNLPNIVKDWEYVADLDAYESIGTHGFYFI